LTPYNSQPKVQPRSAAADKKKGAVTKPGVAKPAAKKARTGRNARPAKKTEAELDSEMADYFESAPNENTGNNNAGSNVGGAVGNGEAMEEIEVRRAQKPPRPHDNMLTMRQ